MSKLNWQAIDTVLLDMDGTLLDLHFDDFFWLHHLPKKLAETEDIAFDTAQQRVIDECERVAGTLAWYCLDIWADKLAVDLMAAKREIQHLIRWRDDAIPFLQRLKAMNKQVVLVTNAHPDSLSLKIERTDIDRYIETLISTHEFGVTKESQSLWTALHNRLGFDNKRTLFIDDSLPILRAAQQFGVEHLIAVKNPSSKRPDNDPQEFSGVTDLRTLLDNINA